MPETFMETDKSIKPKDMRVGDIIVGRHEGDPRLSAFQNYKLNYASVFQGPFEVTRIVRRHPTRQGDLEAGVYYTHSIRGVYRYIEYEPRETLWIIIRDRPGVPRFIEEFPGVCNICRGRVYVGLNEITHEGGSCKR